jgi:periplasmic protein TonB
MRARIAMFVLLLASAAAGHALALPAATPPAPRPGHPHGADVVYPPNAMHCWEKGTATFAFLIDDKGAVHDAKLIGSSGYDDLDRAAQQNVLTWRYVPATEYGKPVAARWRAAVRFELRRDQVLYELIYDLFHAPVCPAPRKH